MSDVDDAMFGTAIDVCSVPYTYVERRVPKELEDEVHGLITRFLEAKGFIDD